MTFLPLLFGSSQRSSQRTSTIDNRAARRRGFSREPRAHSAQEKKVAQFYNFNGTLEASYNDFYRYDESVGKLNDNSLYAKTRHLNCPRNNNMPQSTFIYLTHGSRKTDDRIHYYSISPYAYCGGDPVNRVDEDGRFWNYVAGALIGAAVEYACQVYDNYDKSGEFSTECLTNVDGASILKAGFEGLVSSGVNAIGSAVGKSVAKAVIKNSSSFGAKIIEEATADATGELINAITDDNYSFNVKEYMTSKVLSYGAFSHQHQISNNKAQKAAEEKALKKGDRLNADEKSAARQKNRERNHNMTKTNKLIDLATECKNDLIQDGVHKYYKEPKKKN